MASNRLVTLVAVGDVEVIEDDPDHSFDATREILQSGDVTFGQLEIPIANSGPTQLHGALRNRGINKDPRAAAKVLERTGFDVMSHASNHTMDMSEQSLMEGVDAIRALTSIEIVAVGRSRSEARRAAICEAGGIRFGFIGNCSVPIFGSWAEDRVLPNGQIESRGGVNPLRAQTYYANVDYQPGNKPQILTTVDPDDLGAMVEDIQTLREQVDVLVMSCHWGVHFEPATIAMYQVEAAHAAIDAGADLILGHHPHTIRGIEFYRGKPVIYGLPNFNLGVRDQHEAIVTPWITAESEKSFIAKLVYDGNSLERLSLIPCHLDFKTRVPTPLVASDPRSQDIVKYLEWVCRHNTPDFWRGTTAKRAFDPFQTEFTYDGDEVVVTPRS